MHDNAGGTGCDERDQFVSAIAISDDTIVKEPLTESTEPFRTKSFTDSDGVPDLSHLIVKAGPRAIFDGTYSTVYRGSYNGQEVRFSAAHTTQS